MHRVEDLSDLPVCNPERSASSSDQRIQARFVREVESHDIVESSPDCGVEGLLEISRRNNNGPPFEPIEKL